MLNVAVLTDSRADWGVYLPLLKAMKSHPDIELKLIVTGMHLSVEHGYSINEILAEGFGDYVLYLQDDIQADWLVVLGDRPPMLLGAVEAFEQGIPIAHIQGGDTTTGASKDEQCRHAISRLANLHFPSQDKSAEWLIKTREESWRVKVVGPLGVYNMLDEIKGYNYVSPVVTVIQHPVNPETAGQEMKQTLEAVKGLWKPVVIYPNNDPGHEDMIREIEKAVNYITPIRNLPYMTFQSLLKTSSVIVGNSSVSLHEAPLYGVPCVNIGDRERGRDMWGKVVQVPHDAYLIRQAIDKCLKEGRYKPKKRKVIDGPRIIIDTLLNTPIDDRLMRKPYV